MADQTGGVDVHFMEERGLFPGMEDLDSNVVTLIAALPDFAELPFADEVLQGDLGGDRSLNEEGHPRAATRCGPNHVLKMVIGEVHGFG